MQFGFNDHHKAQMVRNTCPWVAITLMNQMFLLILSYSLDHPIPHTTYHATAFNLATIHDCYHHAVQFGCITGAVVQSAAIYITSALVQEAAIHHS